MAEIWKFAYVSDIVDPSDDVIDAIVSISSINNAKCGIAGVLFRDRRSYLQVLEGQRQEIAGCVLRVAADTRHKRMQVILCAPSMTRIFSDWGMARADLPEGRRSLAAFAEDILGMHPSERVLAVERLCLGAKRVI